VHMCIAVVGLWACLMAWFCCAYNNRLCCITHALPVRWQQLGCALLSCSMHFTMFTSCKAGLECCVLGGVGLRHAKCCSRLCYGLSSVLGIRQQLMLPCMDACVTCIPQ
jgi:hypothetical protein